MGSRIAFFEGAPVPRLPTLMHTSLRVLAFAASLAAAAATVTAQCLPTSAGTNVTLANRDDALSAAIPMGINFPMPGTTTTFTHVVVSTNGVLYLTTGGAAVGAADTHYGTLPQFLGVAGDSPRIAPFWQDLWDAFFTGVQWSVTIDTSVAGRCAISWRDTCEFDSDTPDVDFTAELFANGNVRFSYGAVDTSGFVESVTIGISNGNGAANPGPVDLVDGATSTGSVIYQRFLPGTCDIGGQSLTFTPTGFGYTVAPTCRSAANVRYGTGCYASSDSRYQWFTDAAAAGSALTGQSLQFLANGNDYVALWGGGSFVAPTASATVLTGFAPNDDDGVLTVNLGSPLPIPGGTTSTLVVHSNGNLWFGDNLTSLTDDWIPVPADLLDAPNGGFWSWHDFDIGEAGSGQIKFEEVGSLSFVTWDDVESYPTGTTNRSTVQFQLDRSSGNVTIVWVTVDTNTTSINGDATMVGYSPGGPSQDLGSQSFAALSPTTTSINLAPLSLRAGPAPISTAAAGTNVVYTTDDMREFTAGSGAFLGILIFSTGSLPGVDLGFLGAPGCAANVASLDVIVPMVGATATQTVTFPLPAGVPAGVQVFAQSANLVAPNSLPNGQNAFGLLTSNGVATIVNSF